MWHGLSTHFLTQTNSKTPFFSIRDDAAVHVWICVSTHMGICLEAQFEGIFPFTSSSSEVANSHPRVYTHPRIALTHDRPQCSRAMSDVWRPLNRSTPVSVSRLCFLRECPEGSTEHTHGVWLCVASHLLLPTFLLIG